MGNILFRVNVTREFPHLPHLSFQNIEMLNRVITDKEASIKISQTRLENRTFWPNIEFCRDRDCGKNWLPDAEAFLKGLIRKQLSLEEDIEVKAKSIFIYRDQCMELRKQVNHLITSLKDLF